MLVTAYKCTSREQGQILSIIPKRMLNGVFPFKQVWLHLVWQSLLLALNSFMFHLWKHHLADNRVIGTWQNIMVTSYIYHITVHIFVGVGVPFIENTLCISFMLKIISCLIKFAWTFLGIYWFNTWNGLIGKKWFAPDAVCIKVATFLLMHIN